MFRETVLKPTNFNLWRWVEYSILDVDTIDEYEYEILESNYPGLWERTEELSGLIYNELGVVYKLRHGNDEFSYHMVWKD